MNTAILKQDLLAPAPTAKHESCRAADVLSIVVAVLAATVSAVGLGFPAVYGRNWAGGTSLGNDLVTLVVAIPVLAAAIIYAARGSLRARMVRLGALYYMFYNYAFYVFGIPVTKLYLPLIATFALSGFALALDLGSLDTESISRRFGPRTPARPIAAYMFLGAAMVSFLWISQWVRFTLTGKVPDVNGSQEAYRVIAAVDLSFLVPLMAPSAFLLWKRRPWGFALGVMMNVGGALYMAVMAAVCVFGWILTPGSHLLSNWWFINCVVSCILSLLCVCGLLLSIEPPRATN